MIWIINLCYFIAQISYPKFLDLFVVYVYVWIDDYLACENLKLKIFYYGTAGVYILMIKILRCILTQSFAHKP